MIQLEGISKVFFRRNQARITSISALQDINLKIEKGEYVAVTGSSGAGKTTLLNLIAGLEKPTVGKIWFEGKDLNELSLKELALFRNRTVGYMLQFYCLPAHLTVVEQVMLPLLIAGETIHSARNRAYSILEKLNLRAFARAYPDEISGGQAQRVALARAIANSPLVLLADEPTGNLDEDTATQLINLLHQLNVTEKITLVVVTHSPVVLKQAGRVVRLEAGRLVNA